MKLALDYLLGQRATLCAAGSLPAHGIHRVLVLRPNHRLGNTLLVIPLLSELERLYPGAEVDILSAGEAAPAVFAGYPNVREVNCLNQRVVWHVRATLGMLRHLRAKPYDLAIDAGGGSQSGRLLLNWVQARYKIAASDRRQPSDAVGPSHLAWRPVHLLRQACARKVSGDYPVMDIRLSKEELNKGIALLKNILGPSSESSKRTVMAVFAHATGSKCYSETWWLHLVEIIAKARPEILFVEVIAAHGVSKLASHFPTFYSRDLRKMAAVIAAADVFVSADCGVMHLAAASGTRTLGLFSVTDQRKYAPCGNGSAAIDNRSGDVEQIAHQVIAHLNSAAA